jgi:hypothetical protein
MNEKSQYFADTKTEGYFEKDAEYRYFSTEEDSVEITVD